jgi:hypothetical protein
VVRWSQHSTVFSKKEKINKCNVHLAGGVSF